MHLHLTDDLKQKDFIWLAIYRSKLIVMDHWLSANFTWVWQSIPLRLNWPISFNGPDLQHYREWQTLFTWLCRWLPLRLLKRQSPTIVRFRTTLAQTITLVELKTCLYEVAWLVLWKGHPCALDSAETKENTHWGCCVYPINVLTNVHAYCKLVVFKKLKKVLFSKYVLCACKMPPPFQISPGLLPSFHSVLFLSHLSRSQYFFPGWNNWRGAAGTERIRCQVCVV